MSPKRASPLGKMTGTVGRAFALPLSFGTGLPIGAVPSVKPSGK